MRSFETKIISMLSEILSKLNKNGNSDADDNANDLRLLKSNEHYGKFAKALKRARLVPDDWLMEAIKKFLARLRDDLGEAVSIRLIRRGIRKTLTSSMKSIGKKLDAGNFRKDKGHNYFRSILDDEDNFTKHVDDIFDYLDDQT